MFIVNTDTITEGCYSQNSRHTSLSCMHVYSNNRRVNTASILKFDTFEAWPSASRLDDPTTDGDVIQITIWLCHVSVTLLRLIINYVTRLYINRCLVLCFSTWLKRSWTSSLVFKGVATFSLPHPC